MSSQALYVLIVAGVALLLFVTEWVAPDIVALLVLISLGVGGILDLPALFSGFGSPVVAALIGIFMLTAALQHTGVTAYLSRLILRLTGGLGERPLVGVLTLSAAITSIMMNTVASVALIAPIGRQVAMKRDVSPSRLMMPISYGALLGGMATLLTTSNLLVAGLLSERGLRTFGLLDFLPVGAPIALIGLVYLTLASPLLLPERAPSDQWGGLQFVRQELTRTYRLGMRLHEAYIRPESPLAGRTLTESNLGHQYGVTVSAIVRGRQTFAPPTPDTRLQAGDLLLLQGRPAETETAANDLGLDIFENEEIPQSVLYSTDSELAEVALSPRCALVGQTLGDIRFREKYGINVLAIWHEGRPIRSFLSDHALSHGDALLVQGPPERLNILNREPDFLVLTRLPDVPERTEHAAISLIVLLAFLITVALNWLPVSIAALLGGVIVILTGCETVDQARSSIQWQVLFLIGGMLPMATALEKTGAASFMITVLYQVVGGLGPRGLLLTFFAITAGLAQFTSGQAATLIVGPIALTSALQYGINPLSLMMGVAIGASTGFLSPVSHPANLLVMGPGGYHFADYAKLGTVLVMLTAAGVVLLTPLAYPF